MNDVAAVCLVVTALLAYLNHRFVGLPTTIGVMAGALGVSLAIVGLDALGIGHQLRVAEEAFVRSIDFSEVLLQGMLSLLLFAGALHVDLAALRAYRWQIFGLAVIGTLASTVAIGYATWLALGWAEIELPLAYCLVFGALISPTDPVAVMGILKSAQAPKNLEMVITGESLFNDGVGVAVFAVLASIAVAGGGVDAPAPGWADGALLLAQEAGGGLLLGAAIGYVTYRMLKSLDQYQVEVLITLAAVIGGNALAGALHVSGPLAMVVAGLIVGNHGRERAMSDTTRRYVDMFWELIDEILNAVLFVLIGLEVLQIDTPVQLLWVGALAAAITLAARAATVGLPVALLPGAFRLPPGSWTVLTWGGLRGGISVALALSLPTGEARDQVLTMTYCVVAFSILVQGLTISRVVRRFLPRQTHD